MITHTHTYINTVAHTHTHSVVYHLNNLFHSCCSSRWPPMWILCVDMCEMCGHVNRHRCARTQSTHSHVHNSLRAVMSPCRKSLLHLVMLWYPMSAVKCPLTWNDVWAVCMWVCVWVAACAQVHRPPIWELNAGGTPSHSTRSFVHKHTDRPLKCRLNLKSRLSTALMWHRYSQRAIFSRSMSINNLIVAKIYTVIPTNQLTVVCQSGDLINHVPVQFDPVSTTLLFAQAVWVCNVVCHIFTGRIK